MAMDPMYKILVLMQKMNYNVSSGKEMGFPKTAENRRVLQE
jgi:hypothetical protein